MRFGRTKPMLGGVTIALMLGLGTGAPAAVVGESVTFDSRNYEGIAELLIGRSYADVKVQAYLSLPETGAARFPGVIIEHDTFGVSDDEFDYANELNAAGFATLVLDEYANRRVRSRDDAFNPTRAADALFALKFLAANPLIDPNRVAIVGFSRGGVAAYLTAIEPIRRAILGSSSIRYAAHAAFYPGAPALMIGDGTFGPAPIRFFFGRDDNIAPVAPWLEYFAFLKSANVSWREEHAIYEGGHGFERGYPRKIDRGFLNTGRCPPAYYRLQGGRVELFRLTAGKLVSITRDALSTANCTVPGGTLGRSADAARAKAHEDLKEFLVRAMPAP